MTRTALFALAFLIGAGPVTAQAEVPSAIAAETDPAAKGLLIAEEIDRRDLGWGDSETELTMTLYNAQGESAMRELRSRNLELSEPGRGDLSLTIFDRPRDVAGTVFLSHTYITEADDQWLFLPALKRVKRISSANKSGPFVGSEFAYEDLLSQEVGKYTYEWLRDEPCPGEEMAGLTCHVTKRFPVYENSGYSFQIAWADTSEYRPVQVEFYDRKEDLLKTLTLSDYRHYLDQYWRAHRQVMENHQTGKSTELTFSPYVFQVGLDEGDFQSNRLSRMR